MKKINIRLFTYGAEVSGGDSIRELRNRTDIDWFKISVASTTARVLWIIAYDPMQTAVRDKILAEDRKYRRR